MELSPDQQAAHDEIVEFLGQRTAPKLTMGGYAGVGKTTVTAAAVQTFRKVYGSSARVAYVAFTGKAGSVLKGKLTASGSLGQQDYAGTIHGMIYQPVMDPENEGRVRGWAKRSSIPYDIIVCDEASMITGKLHEDLSAYKKPILYVGDHGQLPPVGDNFGLMKNPDIRLEKIHRQAEGDPIIKVSMLARLEGRIPIGRYGEHVLKVAADTPVLDKVKDLRGVMVLCGMNRTRVDLNRIIRGKLGVKGEAPVAGDRVLCLRNNRNLGVMNGMAGELTAIQADGSHHYKASLKMDAGFEIEGQTICRHQFGEEKMLEEIEGAADGHERGLVFDWGYAMTVHKAQGSESARVMVFEERMRMMDDETWGRWLYTATTRAKERLLMVAQDR